MIYGTKTALVVADLQNDFVDPRGTLYVRGAEALIPFVNAELARAARAGALVVLTQDWHPPDTPHFQKSGGLWPVHCVRDTWGAEFFPALVRPPGTEVVRKGTGGQDGYSGFSFRDPKTGAVGATELEALLRSRGIEQVAIAGVATDYCVKETGLDAIRLGFDVTVLVEGVRPVELQPGDGARALEQVRGAGARLEASGVGLGGA